MEPSTTLKHHKNEWRLRYSIAVYTCDSINRTSQTAFTEEAAVLTLDPVCHIRMVPSSDPVAKVSPKGAYRRHRIGPWCPL